MKRKNLFWSYSGSPNENVEIEHTLKYDDVDAIKNVLDKFGKDRCLSVWEKTMIPDKRFRKLNFFLAKFIFRVADNDKNVLSYFAAHSKTRDKNINELSDR